MKNIRKYIKKIVVFLVCSILLELLVFNHRALFSLTATNQSPDCLVQENTVYVTGMSGTPGYIYVGVNNYAENGQQLPVTITVSIQDEGNVNYYELDDVTIYPAVEKSKYLQIHSYGAVNAIRIKFTAAQLTGLQVNNIIYDAKVPWFISVPRILLVFAGLCLVWCLRPGSEIYKWSWTKAQKRWAVGILIAANSIFFLFLVRSNPAFLNPVWPYHQQYHQLAVSLSQGKVSIDVGNEETLAALANMENPYDTDMRMQSVPYADQVWDICYYEGEFYVYFGIVPALLFYLPYYLITQSAFPTWLGVLISGIGIISGVYYLLAQIRKRWFPKLPYSCYLLLAVLGGNGLNLVFAMLHADFYYLPIVLALCFSVWGLGLILSAADAWNRREEKKKYWQLALGALCLALTAGCRPQFLVGSFLLIPILAPLFWEKRKEKETRMRLLAVALPYIIVAAGIMFYNYIRFDSIFDFGANYNLTTNDMTRRGMNLGRIPDGIFMYVLQPIVFKLSFPFAEITTFYTEYLGESIRDWTYGGALWTRPILLSLFALGSVKKELRQKKLYGFTILSIGLAFVVIIADTQMAGILNRYFTDFLWLLMVPAMIILFQLLEKYQDANCYKYIICFIVIAGAWGVFYELAMALRGSGIMNDNIHRYYLIKSLFQ